MKKLLLLLSFALLLSACTNNMPNDSDNNDGNPVIGEAEINMRLDRALLFDYNGLEIDPSLEFEVYLERPDLNLVQPENLESGFYTSDLPESLQPKLMYVSEVSDTDPESGSMCDRPTFPHRCRMDLDANSQLKDEYTFLVKVTFEDNTYAAEEITVPVPEMLPPIELVEPSSIPSEGEELEVKFVDIGADEYELEVNLCYPYQNDGINPCLNGTMFHLSRTEDGGLKFTYDNEYEERELNLEEGFITIKSNFPLYYEESVEYYLKAIDLGEALNGTPTYFETAAYQVFKP